MNFVKICRALYDYDAAEDGELSFREEDILHIIEDSDPEWWKAQHASSENGTDPATGLVPHNYVEEVECLSTAVALYDYEAQNSDELSFKENQTLTIYQKEDPDWCLAKVDNAFGFVPANYISENSEGQDTEPDDSYPKPVENQMSTGSEPTSPSAAVTPIKSPKTSLADTQYWAVLEIDKVKKKKKKGRLGISSDTIFFASEEDKNPVRHWPMSDIIAYSLKSKHIIVELVGAESLTFDFSCINKKEAEQIAKKIRQYSDAAYKNHNGGKESSGWFKIFKKKSDNSKKKSPVSLPAMPPKDFEERKPHMDTGIQGQQHPIGQKSPRIIQVVVPEDSVDNLKEPDDYNPSEYPTHPAHETNQDEAPLVALVLYAFTAQNGDELSVQADEQIYVIDCTSSEEWWMCRVLYDDSSYKEGVVPANYLQIIDSENTEGDDHTEQVEKVQNDNVTPAENVDMSPKAYPNPAKVSHSGPNPDNVREWTDATGSFKVEAEFVGYSKGKIQLYKVNGVKIAVPIEKMCKKDIHIVSSIIGEDLSELAEASKLEHVTKSKWKSYFTKSGIDSENAVKYAETFVKEKLDHKLMKEMDRETLKSLGFAEGDVMRVLKTYDTDLINECFKAKRSVRFAPEPATMDTDEMLARQLQQAEIDDLRKSASNATTKEEQIKQDELLARKLQQANNPAYIDKWTNFDSSGQTTPKEYGLNLSGSSLKSKSGGRSSNQKGALSSVDADSFSIMRDKLVEANKQKSKASNSDPWKVEKSEKSPVFSNNKPLSQGSQPSSTLTDDWGFVRADSQKAATAAAASSTSLPALNPQPKNKLASTQRVPNLTQTASTSNQIAIAVPSVPSVSTGPRPTLPAPLVPVPSDYKKSNVFVPTRRPAPPVPASAATQSSTLTNEPAGAEMPSNQNIFGNTGSNNTFGPSAITLRTSTNNVFSSSMDHSTGANAMGSRVQTSTPNFNRQPANIFNTVTNSSSYKSPLAVIPSGSSNSNQRSNIFQTNQNSNNNSGTSNNRQTLQSTNLGLFNQDAQLRSNSDMSISSYSSSNIIDRRSFSSSSTNSPANNSSNIFNNTTSNNFKSSNNSAQTAMGSHSSMINTGSTNTYSNSMNSINQNSTTFGNSTSTFQDKFPDIPVSSGNSFGPSKNIINYTGSTTNSYKASSVSNLASQNISTDPFALLNPLQKATSPPSRPTAVTGGAGENKGLYKSSSYSSFNTENNPTNANHLVGMISSTNQQQLSAYDSPKYGSGNLNNLSTGYTAKAEFNAPALSPSHGQVNTPMSNLATGNNNQLTMQTQQYKSPSPSIPSPSSWGHSSGAMGQSYQSNLNQTNYSPNSYSNSIASRTMINETGRNNNQTMSLYETKSNTPGGYASSATYSTRYQSNQHAASPNMMNTYERTQQQTYSSMNGGGMGSNLNNPASNTNTYGSQPGNTMNMYSTQTMNMAPSNSGTNGYSMGNSNMSSTTSSSMISPSNFNMNNTLLSHHSQTPGMQSSLNNIGTSNTPSFGGSGISTSSMTRANIMGAGTGTGVGGYSKYSSMSYSMQSSMPSLSSPSISSSSYNTLNTPSSINFNDGSNMMINNPSNLNSSAQMNYGMGTSSSSHNYNPNSHSGLSPANYMNNPHSSNNMPHTIQYSTSSSNQNYTTPTPYHSNMQNTSNNKFSNNNGGFQQQQHHQQANQFPNQQFSNIPSNSQFDHRFPPIP